MVSSISALYRLISALYRLYIGPLSGLYRLCIGSISALYPPWLFGHFGGAAAAGRRGSKIDRPTKIWLLTELTSGPKPVLHVELLWTGWKGSHHDWPTQMPSSSAGPITIARPVSSLPRQAAISGCATAAACLTRLHACLYIPPRHARPRARARACIRSCFPAAHLHARVHARACMHLAWNYEHTDTSFSASSLIVTEPWHRSSLIDSPSVSSSATIFLLLQATFELFIRSI